MNNCEAISGGSNVPAVCTLVEWWHNHRGFPRHLRGT